jgi:hypothetical protein
MNTRHILFGMGDYFAGAVTGAATAAIVRALISPDVDLALAMVFGMGLGMLVHLPIGLVFSPVLGMFHVMVPGTLIGMYGGMLFAMRDVMQQGTWGHAIGVGAAFGVLVTAGVQLYDRALTGAVGASSDVGGR